MRLVTMGCLSWLGLVLVALEANCRDIEVGALQIRLEQFGDLNFGPSAFLNVPTDLEPLPDGSGRLVVLQLGGTARLANAAGQFLDSGTYFASAREAGFGSLAVAAHPQFAENGLIYQLVDKRADVAADFGAGGHHHNVLIEWQADDPSSAAPQFTSREILRVAQPDSEHNLFDLDFGPDGLLYLALGDGGPSNNDPDHPTRQAAQDLSSIYGSVLRIDPTRTSGPGLLTSDNGRYAVPVDNLGAASGGAALPEIWALGFRSPYRMNFDDATGRLYVGDVGERYFEEINRVEAGGNYGWGRFEGTLERGSIPLAPQSPVHAPPTFAYERDGAPDDFANPANVPGDGETVVGGHVYRGAAIPELYGKYVFADFGRQLGVDQDGSPARLFYGDIDEAGDIVPGSVFEFAIDPLGIPVSVPSADPRRPYGSTNSFIYSLGVDAAGELYVLAADENRRGVEALARVLRIQPGSQFVPELLGDLNFDATLDVADWRMFRDGLDRDVQGLDPRARYQRGDLDFDADVDLDDFALFKQSFLDANGADSFDALLAIPEPTTCLMLALALLTSTTARRRAPRVSFSHALVGFSALALGACSSLAAYAASPAAAAAVDVSDLPMETDSPALPYAGDYLIDPPQAATAARVTRSADGRSVSLHNGLVRRTWRLAPNGACVGFDNLMTGRSMLRSVRPEARVTLNGIPYDVGGLSGQLNHAYLGAAEIDALTADPRALQLVGVAVGEPQERFGWLQRRHAASDAQWPPPGVTLRFDFAPPPWDDAQAAALLGAAGGAADTSVLGRDNQQAGFAPPSDLGRQLLLADEFAALDAAWEIHKSASDPRSSFENEGKPGEIYTPAHTAVYAERALPSGTAQVELTLDVGTDSSSSWGPGIALVFGDRTVKFHIRPQGDAYDGKPMLGLWDGAREHPRVAGQLPLDTTKPWTLRLRRLDDAVLCDARPEGGVWANYARVPLAAAAGLPRAVRIGKLDPRGGGEDHGDPGPLVRCRMMRFAAYGDIDAEGLKSLTAALSAARRFRVSVHYELYDGVPVMCKWITVHNEGDQPLTVNRFRGEELAAVEHANWVETREGVPQPAPEYLHVETDFAFGGFNFGNANRHVVQWRTDPLYSTQVNYLRQSPCLLVAEPTRGPEQTVASGAEFEGFRTFELVYDDGDRERRGLALRRMYRTVAPWVTENPLTHHLLSHDPQRVRQAVDEASAVGFEGIILSFGSGFNMENRDPTFLQTWREVADYAEGKGIELGCYSLFSSRGVGAEHMIVSPAGERPTHGQCPAVTSEWGRQWLETIRGFYEQTGFDQFENDGPYPGDVDVTARPPWQQGELDSRWVQWRLTAGLYRDLRARGVFINAPDYYYLNGSNKCGMGYREVNWSLPRAHQVIHTRQNIYDGTWTKTPSMGWMFVPLAQYHGGGAAATVEPLDEHLDHYRLMMLSNLGLGVQAHYRGPRLFDTDRTRQMVRDAVTWYREYRDILESDVIHGRRADGQDVDWMLHVNPRLERCGLLCAYNPLEEEATRELRVNLYYTGLTDQAEVRAADGDPQIVALDRQGRATLQVTVPAGGMSWYVFRQPPQP